MKSAPKDLKKSIFTDDQEDIQSSDNVTFYYTGNKSDVSLVKTLIKITNEYSSIESWEALKNALECSPQLFAESDAISIIHIANSNFPGDEPETALKISSVIRICSLQILKDPYASMVNDKEFLEFFLKLPDCFTNDFNQSIILNCADFVHSLVKSYNSKIEADESILTAFGQIQMNILNLISKDFFPSELSVALLMPLLDDMIEFLNEEDSEQALIFFSNCIDPVKYSNVSDLSLRSSIHLFMKFPNLYNRILEEPYTYLKDIIKLFQQEYRCIQSAAEIIKPILSDEKGCEILFSLDLCPALLDSFDRLIQYSNKSYAAHHLFEDITLICESSKDGCNYFIDSNLLVSEKLNDCSFKLTIFILRILHASLVYEIFPSSEQALQLTVNAIDKCLDSEESDILTKTLKIIRFLHEHGIEIIENTKEKLEQLSLGEFDEKISNDAISLLKLIESK